MTIQLRAWIEAVTGTFLFEASQELFVRRKDSLLHQCVADRNEIRKIDCEHVDGDVADVRLADKQRSIPLEVIRPAISSWMKKGHVLALQVTGGERAFVRIASLTTQRQIIGDGLAVELLRNDVIDLEGQQRDNGGEMSVFASLLCAPPDKSFKFHIHGGLGRETGLLQRQSRLGLHDFNERRDAFVFVECRPLVVGKLPLTGLRRQRVDPLAIVRRQLVLQDFACRLWRHATLLRPNDPSQDFGAAVWCGNGTHGNPHGKEAR
jgi:hypothetical protein